MTILILHGLDGHAGIHWQQWLHDELVHDGHTVIMPTLPNAHHPSRAEWGKAVISTLQGVDVTQLVIVGHSLGVPTALDYIEQSDKPIHAFVSISGFADDYGSDYNDYFMQEKTIDFSTVKTHLKQSIVIFGDDDPYVPQRSLHQLAENLDVAPISIPHGGHLNTEAGYKEFPLLLQTINSL